MATGVVRCLLLDCECLKLREIVDVDGRNVVPRTERGHFEGRSTGEVIEVLKDEKMKAGWT